MCWICCMILFWYEWYEEEREDEMKQVVCPYMYANAYERTREQEDKV